MRMLLVAQPNVDKGSEAVTSGDMAKTVQSVWVSATPSRHATCRYSWTSPPRRSRRSGRTVAPEGGGMRPAGGC
jgi:hypothetical protein